MRFGVGRAGAGAGAAVLVIVLTACGGPTVSPGVSVTTATDVPTPPSDVTTTPSIVATTPAPGAVAIDGTLLDPLPAAVGGIERRADPETAADIAASADLATSVEAIAVALYIGPGASGAEDLAIVSLARLLPGVFSEGWFRSWRETYDAAACEPAGGVTTGSAEATLGGRTTFIGTCRNGVHTYHVRLVDPDRVVAITAVGGGRLGERIVEGLTE